ncbi:hypothetical protein [Flavobacterium sp.]|uniref:hypothetical protein n=1 Tax=Flavobacterium sp. TaxID=239 RepID=UPI00286EA188|nr:hypothetical protein [Flavobacterium sp.]
MKNQIYTIALFFVSSLLSAQEIKKEVENLKTKMDVFASKTGTIVKFIDSNLKGIKTSYGGLTETRIRKVVSGSLTSYFFQMEKEGKYGSQTASIEHSDLVELLKALKSLRGELEKDLFLNPDYLENKFTTTDGFKVGYYISKGKPTWYINLERYGSDSTIFIENADLIEKSFDEAKNKIEELKIK